MKIKDLMKEKVVMVRPDTKVEKIAFLLVKYDISGIPVVDAENRVVGVVSESDLLRQRVKSANPSFWEFCSMVMGGGLRGSHRDEMKWLMERTAKDIMTSPVTTVDENADVMEAGRLMLEHRIKRLPVTRDGKLAGIVSRHSFVRLALPS